MKKISACLECGRKVYTNDIDLCKRCHQDVGFTYLQNQEVEEVDEGPSLEELGIEESSEGTTETTPEEAPAQDIQQAAEEIKE